MVTERTGEHSEPKEYALGEDIPAFETGFQVRENGIYSERFNISGYGEAEVLLGFWGPEINKGTQTIYRNILGELRLMKLEGHRFSLAEVIVSYNRESPDRNIQCVFSVGGVSLTAHNEYANSPKEDGASFYQWAAEEGEEPFDFIVPLPNEDELSNFLSSMKVRFENPTVVADVQAD